MSSSRHRSQELQRHPLSPIYPIIGPPHRETRRLSTNAGRCRVTNDLLPDVALLEIFDCYVNQPREGENEDDDEDFKRWFTPHAWHTLVHVCRRWRTIVFGSPHRLKLRLLCKATTPVKEMLAVWPPLPIVIGQDRPYEMDNIIVALEHNDRVSEICLWFFANTRFEQVLAAMQQPFPALTRLDISLQNLGGQEEPVIPETFLGGSAPRLQYLKLEGIPFPRLPKLLSSAAGLVTLCLLEIPHSGYISPEAMVRCLSTLTRLESLSLDFESPLSRPGRETRHPHPPTRSILLALTQLFFVGVSEYLEDLVARIDAPLLDIFDITFFHQLIFNTPQITRFVARSPNIQPPVEARIVFIFDSINYGDIFQKFLVGDQIDQRRPVRFEAVISGTDLYLVLPRGFHSYGGTPLHPWGSRLASLHREQAVARSFTSIHGREESLFIVT